MKRIFLALVFLSHPALADEVTVGVDGMVCAFCAAGIEQLFGEEPGVSKVHVDLDKSELQLSTQAATPDDARIKALIDKAGYSTRAITRH
jgi:copper chaperone CopZ